MVYNVKQHNDSIYFSTSRDGIFRFHPDHPENVTSVARLGNIPFRSIAFNSHDKLYAASYFSGLHYVNKDTLSTVKDGLAAAWSMKLDEKENIWLVGTMGVFCVENDSLVKFQEMLDAHDIEIVDSNVILAHSKGIGIYNRHTGTLIREYCGGTNFWRITRHDSLLIAGGKNICGIIRQDSCIIIPFGPKGNIAWETAMDKKGNIYLATQMGLYRIAPDRKSILCVGFKGKCIKTVFIDGNDNLWVGRYY